MKPKKLHVKKAILAMTTLRFKVSMNNNKRFPQNHIVGVRVPTKFIKRQGAGGGKRALFK